MRNKAILILVAILFVFLFSTNTVQASSERIGMYSLLSGELSSPVSVEFSTPLYTALAQYSQQRLDSLNKLLKHFSVQYLVDNTLIKTVLAVDSEPLYSATEESQENTIRTVYSFAPEKVYLSEREHEENNNFLSFLDNQFFYANRLLDSMYPLFEKLPEAFPDLIKNAEDNTNYKTFGRSVRKCILSFKSDYVAAHFPLVLQNLADTDETRRFIGQISFSGLQKIILYYNQNNDILRINYDGVIGLKPDSMRKISLSWRCLHSEQQTTDYITLKSPSVKGYDRYNLLYSRNYVLSDPEQHILNWDFQLDLKSGEQKGKIRYNADFVFAEEKLNGKAVFSDKLNGHDRSIEFIPDIRSKNGQEYEGTLEFTSKSGKIINSCASSGIRISPCEHLKQPGRIPATATDLVSDSDEAIGKEILSRINRMIIHRIISLPQTDLEFLKQDIPEDIWNSIINSLY